MKPIATVILAALALAACQRQTPVMPEPAAPVATATPDRTVAASETTPAQAGVQPSAGIIDRKAFAGTFHGALPCADCPGIDETLELGADSSFTLTDVYRERPGATFRLHGSWSVEADGERLRLDPGSKSGRDRLYAIVSNDELQMLDGEGNPPSSGLDYGLHRRH